MNEQPQYYRARLHVLEELVSSGKNDEKTQVLNRNGMFSPEQNEAELIRTAPKQSNAALFFTELTRFNTWFAMHPEKVCGKEVITTSREFPIQVRGTKEDIIHTIQQRQSTNEIELEALSLELELQLLAI